MKGSGEYPVDWPDISRAVKDEAGWRCVRCRHPDFSPEERGPDRVCGFAPCGEDCLHLPDGKKRVLTVHHLDGRKENVKWWNLAALCQVCHLQIQGRVIMGQGYFLEVSEWMRPYVAGMVAFYHLGEDLSREEVEERMDELMGLWSPEVIGGRG